MSFNFVYKTKKRINKRQSNQSSKFEPGSNFLSPFLFFLYLEHFILEGKGREAKPGPVPSRNRSSPRRSAGGLVWYSGRRHARGHDDPLNKPNKRPDHQKTSEKTNPPARSSHPRCHHLPPSLLPEPPRYITTTASASARHVSSLPGSPPPSASSHTRTVRQATLRARRGAFSGRLLPSPRPDDGRMFLRRLFYRRPPDGLVEISGNILGAFAFSAQYSGNLAILAGCVCANLLARSRWAFLCWTCSSGVSWK